MLNYIYLVYFNVMRTILKCHLLNLFYFIDWKLNLARHYQSDAARRSCQWEGEICRKYDVGTWNVMDLNVHWKCQYIIYIFYEHPLAGLLSCYGSFIMCESTISYLFFLSLLLRRKLYTQVVTYHHINRHCKLIRVLIISMNNKIQKKTRAKCNHWFSLKFHFMFLLTEKSFSSVWNKPYTKAILQKKSFVFAN